MNAYIRNVPKQTAAIPPTGANGFAIDIAQVISRTKLRCPIAISTAAAKMDNQPSISIASGKRETWE